MTNPNDNYGKHPFLILSAACWCMCILQIVGIVLFCRLRGLTIIEKRYPRLVVVEAAVTCFNFAVMYPAWISYTYEYPDISAEWWPSLCLITFSITYQIAPTIETFRIWLISYDLHYLHSSQNRQWKSQIDASYAEKDWYLQNRGKWGNEKYIVRLGFTYYIVASTVVLTVNIRMCINGDDTIDAAPHVFILSGLFHFVHIFTPIYLYFKTPRKLQDQLLFCYG